MQIHQIQKDILTLLMQSDSPQSFSKLLPEEMKEKSFTLNYHLKFLLTKGYVKKVEEGYKLTTKGLKYVSKLTAIGDTTNLFKVSVAIFAFRKMNGKKQVLVQKRLRHPFYGDINSIAGKVHHGEPTIDAASRKLTEETGLKSELEFMGLMRKIKKDEGQEILEDTFYHYFVSNNPTGILDEINKYGENFWIDVADYSKLTEDSADVGPKDLEVFNLLLSSGSPPFFYEQSRVVPRYTK